MDLSIINMGALQNGVKMMAGSTPTEKVSCHIRERDLKIEAAGDFWGHGIKPKIRLCGLWLEKAGFKPGHRVRIIPTQHGELLLRSFPP